MPRQMHMLGNPTRTSAHSASDLSLTQRIAMYGDDWSNKEIAEDIGADASVVNAIRCRLRKPQHYRRLAKKAQRELRARNKDAKQIAWASAWADTFPPMELK